MEEIIESSIPKITLRRSTMKKGQMGWDITLSEPAMGDVIDGVIETDKKLRKQFDK